jgi:excinuclease UvrABC nuclease subunit
MKDYLGQDIQVGSKILWSGGQGQYAGFEKIFEVLAVNTKKITIQRDNQRHKTSVYPTSVVVVDKLLS